MVCILLYYAILSTCKS